MSSWPFWCVQSLSFLRICPIHFQSLHPLVLLLPIKFLISNNSSDSLTKLKDAKYLIESSIYKSLLSLYLGEQRFCWAPGFQPILEYRFENLKISSTLSWGKIIVLKPQHPFPPLKGTINLKMAFSKLIDT